MGKLADGGMKMFGSGRVLVEALDASGARLNLARFLGDTPEFAEGAAQETIESNSPSVAARPVNAVALKSRAKTIKFTIQQMDPENIALFNMGTVASAVQGGSGSVTGEALAASGWTAGLEMKLAYGLIKKTPTDIVVKFGGTAGVAGTDYDVDYTIGTVYIRPGTSKTGAITTDYSYDNTTLVTTITPMKGPFMFYLRFEGDKDAPGPTYFGEYWKVELSPTGDLSYIQADKYADFQIEGKIVADDSGHPNNPSGYIRRIK